MPDGEDRNPFVIIIKNHRARVGRVYGRFTDKISAIRKRQLDSIKDESARTDEEQMAAIRKTLKDNR